MKKVYLLIGLILVVLIAFLFYAKSEHSTGTINFDQSGNATSTFVNEHLDLIKINSPSPGEKISSPVSISGEARGTWYFEASFPITIVDWDGKIIGEGHATAKGDWMTEDFVPFEATIDFVKPDNFQAGTFSERGAIILHNDNPSGDPSKDKAVEMPVVFK